MPDSRGARGAADLDRGIAEEAACGVGGGTGDGSMSPRSGRRASGLDGSVPDQELQCGQGDADVAPDMDEANSTFSDEAPREADGGAEQFAWLTDSNCSMVGPSRVTRREAPGRVLPRVYRASGAPSAARGPHRASPWPRRHRRRQRSHRQGSDTCGIAVGRPSPITPPVSANERRPGSREDDLQRHPMRFAIGTVDVRQDTIGHV